MASVAAPRAGPSTRPVRLRQAQRHGSVPNLKGKSLAPVPEDSALARERSKRVATKKHDKDPRPAWVLDLDRLKTGKAEWLEKDRVVLVLGDPSEDSLNAILYSTAFARTLVLVCPTAAASTSGASPPRQWDNILGSYATLQVVTPPPTSGASAGGHPLPALLFAAQAQAKTWLSSASSQTESTSISTTPNRLPSFLASSHTRTQSSSSTTPRRSMTSSESFRSLPPTPIDPYALSSELSKSRRSSFLITASSKKEKQARSSSHSPSPAPDVRTPFDAILNFLSNEKDETLQSLLQQTLTLTTGVTPYIMSGPLSAVAPTTSPLPISLIHILPHRSPPPLEKVLESFLLTLLPSLAPRAVQRRAQGLVVSSTAWNTDHTPARTEAAHGLLFGALSCPLPPGSNLKSRALLRDWRECILHETDRQEHERECVTPTFPNPTPSDVRPRPHTAAQTRTSTFPSDQTPELISDSSSVSEENSLSSTRVSQELAGGTAKGAGLDGSHSKEKERGFKGWMKRKMGKF